MAKIQMFNYSPQNIETLKAAVAADRVKLGSEAIIGGHENLPLGSYAGTLTGDFRIKEYEGAYANLPKTAQAKVLVSIDNAQKEIWVKVTQTVLNQLSAGIRVRFAVREGMIGDNMQKWAQFELGAIQQPTQQTATQTATAQQPVGTI